LRRFGRWSALWASFYSRDLYRDVVARWKGIGLLYLMLLLAICWIPSAARWVVGLQEYAATEAPPIVKQFPTITIEKGVMRATPPGRHVIQLERDPSRASQPLLIIDDSIDSVPSDRSLEGFILTRREFAALQPSRSDRRAWVLGPGTNINVTPDDVAAFLDSMAIWLPPIGYVFAVAGALAFRLAQALLYGAVAMAFASRHRLKLNYDSAVRLAAVAVTPVVIIRTLIWFGPWEPAWYLRWPAAALITLAYIAFGIRAAAAAPASPSVPEPVLTR
jgi:hypothetical protein